MLENILKNFDFHPEMFIKNLEYMGVGMLCILIVMLVIILITMALNKTTSSDKNDGENGN